MRNKTYKKGLRKVHYTIQQLNRIHGEIVMMLDYAITEKYIVTNFAKQVGKFGTPKEIRMSTKKHVYETINFEELCNLLKVSDNNLKYNTFFDLEFSRGPRVGEIRAFKVKDFNYEKKQLMVNHTMSKKNILKDPKTVASKAPIDLDYNLCKKIKCLIDKLKQQNGFNEEWYIFGGENPISENAIRYATKKYLDLAGINKHIRVHDLRHSCATYLFSIGTPITVISRILRHANPSETMKTYVHLVQQDYEIWLNKINSFNLKQDQKQDQKTFEHKKTLINKG